MKKLLTSLLATLLWLAIPGPTADATILWAGTEDVDYASCTGTCNVEGDVRTYRSAYSRSSYWVLGFTTDPPSSYFTTQTWTGSAQLWFHAQFCVGNGNDCGAPNATVANAQMVRLYDNVGNPTLVVRGTGTAGQVKVSSRTSGGVFTDLITCSGFLNNVINTPTQIDVFIDYGASGTVTLYNNGTQVCTISGNNTNGDGGTTLVKADLGGTSTTLANHWSEVIAATTDTRSKALLRMTPTGNGNATQWSGTNICSSIFPANPYNDGTFAQSATNNQLQQCAVYNTFPGGNWKVDAVVSSARVLRGASGPQHVEFLTRTGGADFTSSDVTVSTSFANYQQVQPTNPNTLTLWTTSDLTAAGFNLGLKSTP